MRYLITFSYDGTKFHGFQRQSKLKNVQGSIEAALSDVLNERTLIKGSGRTDAGVHAYNQCAHFDTTKKVSSKEKKRINEILNKEIVIKKWKLVNDDFHARYSVKKKTYIYKMNIGKFRDEYVGYYYQMKYPLDIKKMKEASILFLGTHDFENFVSGKRDDYKSTILNVKITNHKDIVTFVFTGVGFYRYMIRHLVGALVSVGKGKATSETIKDMLDNPHRGRKLIVVPAEGLYLKNVIY